MPPFGESCEVFYFLFFALKKATEKFSFTSLLSRIDEDFRNAIVTPVIIYIPRFMGVGWVSSSALLQFDLPLAEAKTNHNVGKSEAKAVSSRRWDYNIIINHANVKHFFQIWKFFIFCYLFVIITYRYVRFFTRGRASFL
jgi:hypothetical protein